MTSSTETDIMAYSSPSPTLITHGAASRLGQQQPLVASIGPALAQCCNLSPGRVLLLLPFPVSHQQMLHILLSNHIPTKHGEVNDICTTDWNKNDGCSLTKDMGCSQMAHHMLRHLTHLQSIYLVMYIRT